MTDNSTIYAIATPPGSGAIAIIRLSGENAIVVADSIFRSRNSAKKLVNQKTSSLHFGNITYKGEYLDEVLVSIFRAPHSYTGEDIVEISCHGSIFIQQKIMQLLSESGMRLANPGEFTMRAFLNGKLDLSQAEAVSDLIAAQSKVSHKIAMNQMRGGFSSLLSVLRERLLHFISLIELELDFSEEDVEFADRKQLIILLKEIDEHFNQLIKSFKYGNVIKNGVPVAIAGATNVGKSTLLNVLLKEDRAIVSEIAGTTRDVIEDTVSMDGITIRFIDTAGIRHTTDVIERMGIERTYDRISKARVILYLAEAKNSVEELKIMISSLPLQKDQDLLIVLNKSDQLIEEELVKKEKDLQFLPYPVVFISAKKQQNIKVLQKKILESIQSDSSESDIVVTNIRHYEALQHANEALQRVFEAMENQLPSDLIAQDIREILYYLGEITGEITTDEILGNIFKNFCIGK